MGQAEERGEIGLVLRGERGVELLGGEHALGHQHLAMAYLVGEGLLAAGVDVQRVDQLVLEEDVRERAEAGERARAAHVAGAEEHADLALRSFQPERAAGARAEDGGHQLGRAGVPQVPARQRGQ